MRKLVSLVMTLAVLASMSLSAGIATAAPAAPQRLARTAAQAVGDTVAVINVDGDEIATATVDDITDPFEDVDTSAPRGFRYVSVELTVENTGDDPITVTPGNFGIVDDQGLVYSQGRGNRTDEVEPFADTDLDPGDSISGGLAIAVPAKREIAQVIWLVGQGMLPILVDNHEPIELGTPVTLYSTDYDEQATITTEDVVDEFDDLAKGVSMQRGFRAVGVTLTIENTSEETITPNPDGIFLGTTDGVFWAPDPTIERSSDAIDETPDLADDPIDPGDSVTGFLGFGIPDDREIAYVMYLPDAPGSTRMLRLYDADSGDNATADTGEDTGDESGKSDGGLGPIGGKKKTPTPSDDTGGKKTPQASGGDCDGAAAWQDTTLETLQAWGGVFSGLDLSNLDADTIAQIRDGADTIRDLVAQQADSAPPPAAEDLNDLVTQAYEDSASALDDLADAAEAGDSTAYQDAIQTISDIGTSFTSGDVADSVSALRDVCPEIDQL